MTNPAIDREREIEHFSTRILLGRRPLPDGRGGGRVEELLLPIVLEGDRGLAESFGTLTLSEVRARFKTATLVPQFAVEEGLLAGLKRWRRRRCGPWRRGPRSSSSPTGRPSREAFGLTSGSPWRR